MLQEEDKLSHALWLISQAIKIVKKFAPYPTQIISLLFYFKDESEGLKGKFLEIKTGEGKTLTTAMWAALKILLKPATKINIATSSIVLAQDNYETVMSFYEILGIEAAVLPEVFKSYEERYSLYKSKYYKVHYIIFKEIIYALLREHHFLNLMLLLLMK